MSAAAPLFTHQARLWLVAFAVSALVNVLALGVVAFWVIARVALETVAPRDPARSETVALIIPQMVVAPAPATAAAAVEPEPPPPPPPPSQYARTSPDQAEVVPERADFIGERNTRATSDATPSPLAPDQPNQRGREPREDEVETTQSRYQDGDLAHDRITRPVQPTPPEATSSPAPSPEPADAPEPMKRDGEATPPTPPAEPPRDRLAEGPVPVERRVEEAKPEEVPKPAQPERREEGTRPDNKAVAAQPKPADNSAAPGFRGNQSKTRLVGSITRTGRSALNVEDSALGRYHAAVSRAVEKEWQLNCVRNRDYITPGQLTLRVMLEASGKVRSMGVVEELGVGNIQKGFTLNSIRDAEIPAMPTDLKGQLDGDPLELIYRFNF